MASILEINSSLLEMLQPTLVRDGLRLRINVNVSHSKAIDANIESVMRQAQQRAELAEIIKDAWKLVSVPLISQLRFTEQRESLVQSNAVGDKPLHDIENGRQGVSPLETVQSDEELAEYDDK